MASLGLTHALGFGLIGVLRQQSSFVISENLAKRPWQARFRASEPRSKGIAEQTNDYFFRACCGALLQVASPRPATPTVVLRAHLFTIPRRRAGLGHLSGQRECRADGRSLAGAQLALHPRRVCRAPSNPPLRSALSASFLTDLASVPLLLPCLCAEPPVEPPTADPPAADPPAAHLPLA